MLEGVPSQLPLFLSQACDGGRHRLLTLLAATSSLDTQGGCPKQGGTSLKDAAHWDLVAWLQPLVLTAWGLGHWLSPQGSVTTS